MTEPKDTVLPAAEEIQVVSPPTLESALDTVAATSQAIAALNRRLNVAVISTSNPSGPDLIAARQAVSNIPEVSAAFTKARDEGWDADRLADHVANMLGDHVDAGPTERYEAARYLVDEFTQVGDALLMVDRETGRAVAQITDDDLYVPAPVPREGGTLAVPLPRLKPEIEGYLVHRRFSEARDEQLLAKMTVRAEKSGLVTTEATQRLLLAVTQQGRKQLVDELRDMLPTLLKDSVSGGVKRFLSAFQITSEAPFGTDMKAGPTKDFYASVRTPIQDPTTFNLRFNRLGIVSRSVANQWAYEIARHIIESVPVTRESWPLDKAQALSPEYVWAAVPDVAQMIPHIHPMIVSDLPAPLLGVVFPAGVLVIDPDSYRCEMREVFDRWEIGALFKGTLWLDESTVQIAEVMDLPTRTITAELVR
jgi:hypothetical protein